MNNKELHALKIDLRHDLKIISKSLDLFHPEAIEVLSRELKNLIDSTNELTLEKRKNDLIAAQADVSPPKKEIEQENSDTAH